MEMRIRYARWDREIDGNSLEWSSLVKVRKPSVRVGLCTHVCGFSLPKVWFFGKSTVEFDICTSEDLLELKVMTSSRTLKKKFEKFHAQKKIVKSISKTFSIKYSRRNKKKSQVNNGWE